MTLFRIVFVSVFAMLICPAYSATMRVGSLVVDNAITNYASYYSATGSLNTSFGVNVRPLKGSALRNTFVGFDIAYATALNSGDDLTNSDNTVLGDSCLINLNGGYRNVAIGSTALQAMIDGHAHIGIGYRALTSMKGGHNCIGIGDGALFEATNLFGCVGVGIEAGLNLTNGADLVTMYGYHAGYGTFQQLSSPGYGSTWIGAESGGVLRTNVAHIRTTALGYRAGYFGGSNCTYLGAYAGSYNTNDGLTLVVDGLDRSTYFAEKTNALLYGTFATTMPGQTLAINAGLVTIPWGTLTIKSNLTVLGTTNQIIFGATNIAPATTATPDKWVSVQISGESTTYRLPLYK